jgi:hypothetical protein
MAMFGLIGIALALFLAWQWGRVAVSDPRPAMAETPHTAPTRPPPRPPGNAAFDAYRDDMLARLEAEQAQFVAFLDRLRHARDAEEFDRFMKDRTAA